MFKVCRKNKPFTWKTDKQKTRVALYLQGTGSNPLQIRKNMDNAKPYT